MDAVIGLNSTGLMILIVTGVIVYLVAWVVAGDRHYRKETSPRWYHIVCGAWWWYYLAIFLAVAWANFVAHSYAWATKKI